jgi:hypothetical protein
VGGSNSVVTIVTCATARHQDLPSLVRISVKAVVPPYTLWDMRPYTSSAVKMQSCPCS